MFELQLTQLIHLLLQSNRLSQYLKHFCKNIQILILYVNLRIKYSVS
jgi:hypothetical protein